MQFDELIEIEPKVRLSIRDWGQGKPIVFIPGWPFGHEMYEYQFTHLPRQGYRCIGITMRGFGKSSKPWGEYNYNIFADDIKKVLQVLDLHDVTLAGHSMGGAIALHYITRHKSERVSRLALISAAAPSFTKRPDFPYGIKPSDVDSFIRLCGEDRAKFIEDIVKIFFRSKNAVSPKLRDWFHNMAMEASPQATATCLIALRDTDLSDELAQINIPTAIFHSIHDKICLFELAEALALEIKGSKLITFKNSGHGLFYEEKDKFNTELRNFIG